MAHIMEFLLNLLLLNGRFISKIAIKTVHEAIQRCSKYQKKLLIKYDNIICKLEPYDNMLEFINQENYHANFLEAQNSALFNDIQCKLHNICNQFNSDHHLFQTFQTIRPASKTNLSRLISDVPQKFSTQSSNSNNKNNLDEKNNDTIIDQLNLILKSQQCLFKNLLEVVFDLEKSQMGADKEKFRTIQKKLKSCLMILTNKSLSNTIQIENEIDNLVNREITKYFTKPTIKEHYEDINIDRKINEEAKSNKKPIASKKEHQMEINRRDQLYDNKEKNSYFNVRNILHEKPDIDKFEKEDKAPSKKNDSKVLISTVTADSTIGDTQKNDVSKLTEVSNKNEVIGRLTIRLPQTVSHSIRDRIWKTPIIEQLNAFREQIEASKVVHKEKEIKLESPPPILASSSLQLSFTTDKKLGKKSHIDIFTEKNKKVNSTEFKNPESTKTSKDNLVNTEITKYFTKPTIKEHYEDINIDRKINEEAKSNKKPIASKKEYQMEINRRDQLYDNKEKTSYFNITNILHEKPDIDKFEKEDKAPSKKNDSKVLISTVTADSTIGDTQKNDISKLKEVSNKNEVIGRLTIRLPQTVSQSIRDRIWKTPIIEQLKAFQEQIEASKVVHKEKEIKLESPPASLASSSLQLSFTTDKKLDKKSHIDISTEKNKKVNSTEFKNPESTKTSKDEIQTRNSVPQIIEEMEKKISNLHLRPLPNTDKVDKNVSSPSEINAHNIEEDLSLINYANKAIGNSPLDSDDHYNESLDFVEYRLRSYNNTYLGEMKVETEILTLIDELKHLIGTLNIETIDLNTIDLHGIDLEKLKDNLILASICKRCNALRDDYKARNKCLFENLRQFQNFEKKLKQIYNPSSTSGSRGSSSGSPNQRNSVKHTQDNKLTTINESPQQMHSLKAIESRDGMKPISSNIDAVSLLKDIAKTLGMLAAQKTPYTDNFKIKDNGHSLTTQSDKTTITENYSNKIENHTMNDNIMDKGRNVSEYQILEQNINNNNHALVNLPKSIQNKQLTKGSEAKTETIVDNENLQVNKESGNLDILPRSNQKDGKNGSDGNYFEVINKEDLPPKISRKESKSETQSDSKEIMHLIKNFNQKVQLSETSFHPNQEAMAESLNITESNVDEKVRQVILIIESLAKIKEEDDSKVNHRFKISKDLPKFKQKLSEIKEADSTQLPEQKGTELEDISENLPKSKKEIEEGKSTSTPDIEETIDYTKSNFEQIPTFNKIILEKFQKSSGEITEEKKSKSNPANEKIINSDKILQQKTNKEIKIVKSWSNVRQALIKDDQQFLEQKTNGEVSASSDIEEVNDSSNKNLGDERDEKVKLLENLRKSIITTENKLSSKSTTREIIDLIQKHKQQLLKHKINQSKSAIREIIESNIKDHQKVCENTKAANDEIVSKTAQSSGLKSELKEIEKLVQNNQQFSKQDCNQEGKTEPKETPNLMQEALIEEYQIDKTCYSSLQQIEKLKRQKARLNEKNVLDAYQRFKERFPNETENNPIECHKNNELGKSSIELPENKDATKIDRDAKQIMQSTLVNIDNVASIFLENIDLRSRQLKDEQTISKTSTHSKTVDNHSETCSNKPSPLLEFERNMEKNLVVLTDFFKFIKKLQEVKEQENNKNVNAEIDLSGPESSTENEKTNIEFNGAEVRCESEEKHFTSGDKTKTNNQSAENLKYGNITNIVIKSDGNKRKILLSVNVEQANQNLPLKSEGDVIEPVKVVQKSASSLSKQSVKERVNIKNLVQEEYNKDENVTFADNIKNLKRVSRSILKEINSQQLHKTVNFPTQHSKLRTQTAAVKKPVINMISNKHLKKYTTAAGSSLPNLNLKHRPAIKTTVEQPKLQEGDGKNIKKVTFKNANDKPCSINLEHARKLMQGKINNINPIRSKKFSSSAQINCCTDLKSDNPNKIAIIKTKSSREIKWRTTKSAMKKVQIHAPMKTESVNFVEAPRPYGNSYKKMEEKTH